MRFDLRFSVLALFVSATLMACSGGQQTTTTTTTTDESVEMTMVRVVHAIPDGPSYDIWVGDAEAASNMQYQNFTRWTEVPAGEQDVVLSHGESRDLTDTFNFLPNRRYWVIPFGTLNSTGSEVAATFIIAVEEEYDAGDETWYRLVNAVSEGEAYGLVNTTGGGWAMDFPNQGIGTVSEFKRLNWGDSSFDLLLARDTGLNAVNSLDLNVGRNTIYTFVAVGRSGTDSVEVLVIADTPPES